MSGSFALSCEDDTNGAGTGAVLRRMPLIKLVTAAAALLIIVAAWIVS